MRTKAIFITALLIVSLAIILSPTFAPIRSSFATAPTVRQTGVFTAGSGTDTTCVLSGSVSSGDTILVFASSAQNSEQTITASDSSSNPYTNIGTEFFANGYYTNLQEDVLISTNVASAASDTITISGLLNHDTVACVDFEGAYELSGSVSTCSYAQTTGSSDLDCAAGDVGAPVGGDCTNGHWELAGSGTNIVSNTNGDCPEGGTEIRVDTNLVPDGGGADWTWSGTSADISVGVAIVLDLTSAPSSVSVTLNLNLDTTAAAISPTNYFRVNYTLSSSLKSIEANSSTTTFTADPSTTVSISAETSASTSTQIECLQMPSSCTSVSFGTGSGTTLTETYYYYEAASQNPTYLVSSNVTGYSAPSFFFSTIPSSSGSSDSPLSASETLAMSSPSTVWPLISTLPSATNPLVGSGGSFSWNLGTTISTVSAPNEIGQLVYYYQSGGICSQCINLGNPGSSSTLNTGSTTTTSTTTFTREYPFIDDVILNVPPNTNVSETFNLVVDNSGAGSAAQLLRLSFSGSPSYTSLSIPSSEFPFNVGANDKGDLPARLQINLPGLKTGSYTITGSATFLKYNGQTYAYVQGSFAIKINSGQSFLLLLESLFPWLLIIIVVTIVLTALFIMRKRL